MNPTNASTSCRDAGKWCPPACVQTSASSNQSAHSSDAAGGTASSASPAITSARAIEPEEPGTNPVPPRAASNPNPRVFLFFPREEARHPTRGDPARAQHDPLERRRERRLGRFGIGHERREEHGDGGALGEPDDADERAARAPVSAERREDRVPSVVVAAVFAPPRFQREIVAGAQGEVDGGVRERDDRVRIARRSAATCDVSRVSRISPVWLLRNAREGEGGTGRGVMSERGGGRGMVGRGRRRDDDDDTSGHPGIGDPAREVSSRRDRGGAHRFPCRAKTRMSRAGGASRPGSLAPPARLPDWPTDGRRRTTRTRTRAGFSLATRRTFRNMSRDDSITRDRTSSLHRVARAAARAHLAPHGAPAPPPALARARSSRRSSRSSRSSRRARPRASPAASSAPPPRRVARSTRATRARRARRPSATRSRTRRPSSARGSARRSASRTPPTPSARSSARSTPRAVPEGAGYGTHTRPSPSPPRRRRRLYPPPTTTPLLLLLLLLLDDDAVRPRPRRARGPGRLRRSPRTLRTLRTLRPERRGVDDGGDARARCRQDAARVTPEGLARAYNATSAAAEDDSYSFSVDEESDDADERDALERGAAFAAPCACGGSWPPRRS